MRRSVLAFVFIMAVIAVTITATVCLADENTDDPGSGGGQISRQHISLEEYAKICRLQWATHQKHALVIYKVLESKPGIEERRELLFPVDEWYTEAAVWHLETMPPAGTEKLDQLFIRLFQAAGDAAGRLVMLGDVHDVDNLNRSLDATKRLQPEVVSASQPIGGLTADATAEVQASTVALSWTPRPINTWAPEEMSEDPIESNGAELARLRDQLRNLNAEWKTRVDRGDKVEWDHYFRLCWRYYSTASMLQVPTQYAALQQQAQSTALAIYAAIDRVSQTGEKLTPEREKADQAVIAYMAAMLPTGLAYNP